jgi:shikimate kinase
MDIASIFAQHSEGKFRDLESEVLVDLLKHDNQIISLGGGVIVRSQNRQAIEAAANTKTFFLNCDSHILHQRIISDKKTAAHRPALTSFAGAIAEVEHLLQQRLPWYREVMDFEIDGSQLTPEQIASRIIELCPPSDRADKRA